MLPSNLYASGFRIIGYLTEKYAQRVCNLDAEFAKLKKQSG